ncbi:related to Protein TSD2 [Pseudozyma flocculosa]|uniref:Related to Protein TSD2 n=1 Tax=Pseudozyma flocculosa TaxID=84751 RepID=A0A5C3FDE7_9BASI|nr:related to Protein TSD2 [Pseudozyma flocculosa]
MVIVSSPSSSTGGAPHAGPSSRRQDYTHAYQRIRTSSRTSASSSSSSVLVLVSPDVDAICATRILTALLTEDDIPHRIIPVEGYRGLLRVLREDVEANPDLRSIVMVNLGSINERVWIWDDGDIEMKLQRPGGEREAFERLEFDVDASDSESSDGEGSDTGSSDDDDDEEEDDDDEAEDRSEAGDAGQRRNKKRRKRSPAVSGSEGEEDASDDGDRSIAARKRRRKRDRQQPDRPARLTAIERQRLRNVLSRYYNRGTNVGMSVAGMMYLLADKLGRGGRDGLWLAILGLTSQYLAATISTDTYDAFASAYASEVHAIEPTSTSSSGGAGAVDPWSADSPATAGGAKGKGGRSSSGGGGGADGSNMTTAAAALVARARPGDPDADDAAIRVQPSELRFVLYRHWSLESSMYHTAYVASKLGIWQERGMGRLRSLMAKMGFSLTNCRQHFPHMALDLRKTLVSRLEQIAPEYGLTELTYRGFTRGFGFRSSPLSAADVVEGLSALLVAAHGIKIEVEVPGMGFAGGAGGPLGNSLVGNGVGPGGAGSGSGGSELFNAKRLWSLSSAAGSSSSGNGASGASNGNGDPTLPPDSQVDPSTVETSTLWRKNFYEAYRALDRGSTSVSLLRSSLMLSQSLHRAIVGRGTGLIVNQSIRTLKNFRMAILKDGPDLELFTHVDVLAKLARWLVDALRDKVWEQERNRALQKRAAKRAAGRRAKKRRRSSALTGGDGDGDGGEDEGEQDRQDGDDGDDDVEIEFETKPLPFLLASLDPARDIFLVLGQVGAPMFGDTEPNRFGLAFQQAASQSGARVRYDRFETAAVEVRRADLAAFVEAVHLKA